MHALRTVIIQHNTPGGLHFDWLIEDPSLHHPSGPMARLWTARVLPPPDSWPSLGRFALSPIPSHRRAYLDYQGPVSGDRGRVQRVAQGYCLPMLWTSGRIVLNIRADRLRARIDMRQQSRQDWVAVVVRD